MVTLKLMWMPDDDTLWDVASERSVTEGILPTLSAEVRSDLQKWAQQFRTSYDQWLKDRNSGGIHDVSSEIVREGFSIVKKIEEQTGHPSYYWFDVDRSTCSDHEWEKCPLCQEALRGASECHRNNRYFCDSCRLVFPLASTDLR